MPQEIDYDLVGMQIPDRATVRAQYSQLVLMRMAPSLEDPEMEKLLEESQLKHYWLTVDDCLRIQANAWRFVRGQIDYSGCPDDATLDDPDVLQSIASMGQSLTAVLKWLAAADAHLEAVRDGQGQENFAIYRADKLPPWWLLSSENRFYRSQVWGVDEKDPQVDT